MVLNVLRKHDNLKEIECLEELHKHVKYFYMLKSEKYDAVCSNTLAENFKGAEKFKKTPSATIHFPG